MGDSQKIAPKNSPKIAKMIAIHQNCRRYCRKVILYPIWGEMWFLVDVDEQKVNGKIVIHAQDLSLRSL